ncbi:DUF2750 domain-containing protein [Microbulbifer hydrolyticus]|uniref:DUF2750 domain-containing protein n=1 Tax=Microbulbifer hydrolyticus TaxID=48074 RepID=A0A6P1TB06_9GAMM|nr:DUF2750 domain-containing protein [Microbulbifer hydrolyticus]MBB5211413.1 hypothetical protein [Microbulbifer hydrolyticus]QHQ37832.1 DUF2750 domain-containing protein [Microbulbifer hydrolyticus]
MEDSPQLAYARHDIFVREVSKRGSMWALHVIDGEGWGNYGVEGGGTVFPLWSSESLATACASRSFPGYEAKEVNLKEFIELFIPSLVSQDIWIGLNLSEELAGLDIPAHRFEEVISMGAAS